MFIAMATFCLRSHAADAALTVNTYDVRGSTVNEIASDLNRNSPLVVQGRRMQGRTEWNIQTSYHWRTDGHSCVLDQFDATLKVEMILPHWIPPRRPSPQLLQQWERYIAALRKHEDGHLEIGEDAQQEMLVRAKSLGPAPDCDLLAQRIDDLVAAVIDAHHKLELEYDDKTNHGETQGAHFP
jgi:predicted secreted Zn-dependent protease